MPRLRMTNADYVAIAVSPALIMALVGSLVFFLIEVLYVGDYEIRLNHVFALFVFATVLIARIAIEFGSERAAMFSMPLGLLTYIALMKFVEHQGPLSWLFNLLLLALVWWCAHKLTWDCTVIDDNEDASGEGLLGKVGLDTAHTAGVAAAPAENELLAERDRAAARPWWKRLLIDKQGPHAPGLWVLYFSVAALPLFGIGQGWIPAGDVGRRRYAFGLLTVYVAAALCLLVTTSFLGLRRYLRQRQVEMPGPMAATWVSLGGVLIVLVMLFAALVPRPNAEYAISQAPWQASSPGGAESSEISVGDEGTVDPAEKEGVAGDQPEAPPGSESGQKQGTAAEGESDAKGSSEGGDPGKRSDSGEPPASDSSQPSQENSERSPAESDKQGAESNAPAPDSQQSNSGGDPRSNAEEPRQSSGEPTGESKSTKSAEGGSEDGSSGGSIRDMFKHPELSTAMQPLQAIVGSIGNLFKLLIYVLLGLAAAYFAWTRRAALARALAEIIRSIREFFARLFSGSAASRDAAPAAATGPRRCTFGEYTDPFASGRDRSLTPVELVRYTFEAFEAWAGDRGRPRSPDQTPQELVRSVLPPQTPMYDQARRLAQLYSEAAYSAASVNREASSSLQSFWQMMRATGSTAARREIS